MLLHGLLDGQPKLLGCIYAPNIDQSKFWDSLTGALAQFTSMPWILGGDYNCALDIALDRSHPPTLHSPALKQTEHFCHWVTHWGLEDAWRAHHPCSKLYSFHSVPHNLRVRLDRFLCSPSIIPKIYNTDYLGRVVSDHDAHIIRMQWRPPLPPVPTWRLPRDCLTDQVFKHDQAQTIRDYFTHNTNTTTSRLTEWDAFNIVVRGECITQIAGEKRTLERLLTSTEQRLATLTQQADQNMATATQVADAKTKYGEALATLRKYNFKAYAARMHQHRDKTGTLLAWLAKQNPEVKPITEIVDSSGHLVRAQNDILQAFHHYYASLYRVPQYQNHAAILYFLDQLRLPGIPEADRTTLVSTISHTEVSQAIRALARNKAPGLDGLPLEYFDTFSALLSPRLVTMFEAALESGELPRSLRESVIVSFLKPHRDPQLLPSYRPITLLSVDCKILGKLLADRYSQILCPLIHPDQNGFVPGRSTSLNLRRFFHIQDQVHSTYPNAACLILDLEKAFDTLLWPYLFEVLRRMGAGPLLLKYTKLLYTNLTSRVRIGGYISAPFDVERGTRQGCPLSPLIFAMTMEPLAIRLRREGAAWSIPLADTVHCVSLYADDLLLYIRDATSDLSTIWATLTEFTAASGLRINWEKSTLYPLHSGSQLRTIRLGTRTLAVCATAPRYLGVRLYHSPANLYEGNHRATLSGLRSAVGFWRQLPLAPIGKIAIAKMIMVPRLLYHFTNLPVIPPRSFFNELDELLRSLIWGSGRRRIALSKLQLPTTKGGMGAPSFESYFLAAQLQWVSYWTANRHWEETRTPQGRIPTPEIARLLLPGVKPKRTYSLQVCTAQRCMRKVHRMSPVTPPYSPKLPLVGRTTSQPLKCGCGQATTSQRRKHYLRTVT